MKIENAIRQVAEELELPYDVCYKAYMSSWRFILLKAQEQPLNENMSIEEFSRLRPNFNIPSLGKLFITPESFERKSKKLKIIKKLKLEKELQNAENKENQANG